MALGIRSIPRRRLVIVLAGCAGLLALALYALHLRDRYKHFAVHDPGRVYRSAWVDAEVYGELIRKHRIKTVINLCFPGEMGDRNVAQRQAVEAAGARLIELPFPPNDTWDVGYPSIAEMERLLDDESIYPIWIHCQHGRERTVKALSMYDIRQRKMTAQRSLESMPLFDIDHPWPIVVFAFNYETKINGPKPLTDVACPCVDPAGVPATAAAAKRVE